MMKWFSMFVAMFALMISQVAWAQAPDPVGAARMDAEKRLAEVAKEIATAQETFAAASKALSPLREAFEKATKEEKKIYAKHDVLLAEFRLIRDDKDEKGNIIPSKLRAAEERFNNATAAWKSSVSPTTPDDVKKANELVAATKQYKQVAEQVQHLRARIINEYAYRFQPPLPASVEGIVTERWNDYVDAHTAGLDAWRKAKVPYDAAKAEWTDAKEALRLLREERDRLIQVINSGKMTESVDSIEKKIGAMTTGFQKLELKVESVGEQLLTVNENVVAGSATTETNLDLLVAEVGKTNAELKDIKIEVYKINGKLVTMQESVNALAKLTDERTQQLLTKIAAIQLPADESVRVEAILTKVTDILEKTKGNDRTLEAIDTQLNNLLKRVEENQTSSGQLYVQFYDPSNCRWYRIDAVTKTTPKG